MERCWVQITSGKGPSECGRAVFHVMQIFSEEAQEHQITIDVLELIEGKDPNTIKSVLLSLRGEHLSHFASTWEGCIQWISKSPFRPHHKRKNWFVGLCRFTPPPEEMFSRKDVKFETMKASGPGGQHVNTSNTAIRVTHIPTQLVAKAQEERSQYLNKKLALARLVQQIEQRGDDAKKDLEREQWELHNDLERGNPVRTFYGKRCTIKK